jgi:adenylosuccinate synthase
MPAFIVTGLGFGDEGKGAVVDHLTREHNARATVFVNGGAQRAHNVVSRSGSPCIPDTHHTFSQFGSGTFAGAETWHSKHSLIDPHAFFLECDELSKYVPLPWKRVMVQRGAKVVTPFHIYANKLREIARGADRHGSCGMGIGETVWAEQQGIALRVEDLAVRDSRILYGRLREIQAFYERVMHDTVRSIKGGEFLPEWRKLISDEVVRESVEIYRIFARVIPVFDELIFEQDQTYIFEGSQGVLLDEFNGFHPHTTWSTTTGENARKLLAKMHMHYAGYREPVKHIGVMRSYMTRHGQGPFPTEDASLTNDFRFLESDNGHGEWQGAWRRGWTDLAAIEYALRAIGDPQIELAVTHLDRVQGDWKIALNYDQRIAPPVFRDRNYWLIDRAEMLNRLQDAKPAWAEFTDMNADVLLEVIEAQLDLPIHITGYGPNDYTSRAPILA